MEKSIKTMESPTKKISETIAAIIPLLVVCSCIRLITYYGHWDIPIFDYLTSSEILLSFAEPIFKITGFISGYLALVVGLILIMTFWVVYFSNKTNEMSDSNERAKEEKYFFYKLNKNKWWLTFTYLIGGGFIIYLAWYEFKTEAAIVFHAFIWSISYDFLTKYYATKTEDKFKPIIIASVLTILSFSFFIGRFDWHTAETYPDSYTIMLSDSSIVETSTNKIYVGKTSDFYFLYERSSHSTTILPSSEIKSIKTIAKKY